jgi:hypothetical protein
MSAFRDRGVPKPTSECAACPSPDGSSAWASAKGGEARWPESSVREVEVPRPSCSSRAQVRRACSRGITSVHAGEGSERPQESACPVLGPARPTFPKKALVLPFIVVRRGSRCTMGGVAECYVSSGGRASALGTCQCDVVAVGGATEPGGGTAVGAVESLLTSSCFRKRAGGRRRHRACGAPSLPLRRSWPDGTPVLFFVTRVDSR